MKMPLVLVWGGVVTLAMVAAASSAQEGTAKLIETKRQDTSRQMALPTCAGGAPVSTANGRFVCMNDIMMVDGKYFAPAKMVTCNWNWSGSGNDDADYVIPVTQNAVAYCGSIGRSYRREMAILQEIPEMPITNPVASPIANGQASLSLAGRCFQPKTMVTCNWNWSGSGNDDADYVIPTTQNPNSYCASIGRTYRQHISIMGECS